MLVYLEYDKSKSADFVSESLCFALYSVIIHANAINLLGKHVSLHVHK